MFYFRIIIQQFKMFPIKFHRSVKQPLDWVYPSNNKQNKKALIVNVVMVFLITQPGL